jgi:hypothetical protein
MESVRHIVIFKFQPDASQEKINRLTQAFRSLQNKIPGIINFEHGINNSPEGLNQGFTHIYLLTFDSVEARDTYLPHPAHQQFGKLAGELGIIEQVFVVDYIQKPNET